jgi:hypothetical protein
MLAHRQGAFTAERISCHAHLMLLVATSLACSLVKRKERDAATEGTIMMILLWLEDQLKGQAILSRERAA